MKREFDELGDPYASCAEEGLRALRGPHRTSVAPADPRRLTGSVDMEACLGRVAAYEGHAKWDYGVGFVAPDGAARCASGSRCTTRHPAAFAAWSRSSRPCGGGLMATADP